MTKRKGRIALAAAGALVLAAFASPDNRADIRILAHAPGDLAPQKVQAVVDLGVVAFSLLVTWSKRLAY